MENDWKAAQDSYRQARYDAYIDERKKLIEASLAVSERYDKWVLTLAGAGLGLSVTFIDKIANTPEPWTVYLLGGGWIGFIASIVLEMFALAQSQSATNEQLESSHEEYRVYLLSLDEINSSLFPKKRQIDGANVEKIRNRVRLLNRVSLWCLVAGIAGVCAFSLANFPGVRDKNSMTNESKDPNVTQSELESKSQQPANRSRGSFIPPSAALPPPPPVSSKDQSRDPKTLAETTLQDGVGSESPSQLSGPDSDE